MRQRGKLEASGGNASQSIYNLVRGSKEEASIAKLESKIKASGCELAENPHFSFSFLFCQSVSCSLSS